VVASESAGAPATTGGTGVPAAPAGTGGATTGTGSTAGGSTGGGAVAPAPPPPPPTPDICPGGDYTGNNYDGSCGTPPPQPPPPPAQPAVISSVVCTDLSPGIEVRAQAASPSGRAYSITVVGGAYSKTSPTFTAAGNYAMSWRFSALTCAGGYNAYVTNQ